MRKKLLYPLGIVIPAGTLMIKSLNFQAGIYSTIRLLLWIPARELSVLTIIVQAGMTGLYIMCVAI